MSDALLLMIAARVSTVLSMWAVLIGSSGAMAFPDLVRSELLLGESLVDRGTVRLIAAPLVLASSVLLTDHYFAFTKGLF